MNPFTHILRRVKPVSCLPPETLQDSQFRSRVLGTFSTEVLLTRAILSTTRRGVLSRRKGPRDSGAAAAAQTTDRVCTGAADLATSQGTPRSLPSSAMKAVDVFCVSSLHPCRPQGVGVCGRWDVCGRPRAGGAAVSGVVVLPVGSRR